MTKGLTEKIGLGGREKPFNERRGLPRIKNYF